MSSKSRADGMRQRLTACCWIWAVALAGASAAQTALPDPALRDREFTRNHQYLTHLKSYRKQREVYVASPEWKSRYLQQVSYFESFVGKYATAVADDDLLASPPPARPELAKTFGEY